MTRLSANEYRDGYVWDGFDYSLQVWVIDGAIQPCAHPLTMRQRFRPCCNQHWLAGLKITEVEGAERRWCGRCQTFATATCTAHLHALA